MGKYHALNNSNIKETIRILYLIDPISNFDPMFTRLHSVRSFKWLQILPKNKNKIKISLNLTSNSEYQIVRAVVCQKMRTCNLRPSISCLVVCWLHFHIRCFKFVCFPAFLPILFAKPLLIQHLSLHFNTGRLLRKG